MYPTDAIAEEALLAAWATYTYRTGDGPVAVYRCDDCGSYHLTSKGPMNQRLAQALASGDISRQKDSDAWMNKIKRTGRH
jgi:hypothetical protein